MAVIFALLGSCEVKMVKLTMIARVTDGLPLAEGLDDGRDIQDSEFYKQQVKALFKNLSRGQNEPSRMSVETGPYVFQYPSDFSPLTFVHIVIFYFFFMIYWVFTIYFCFFNRSWYNLLVQGLGAIWRNDSLWNFVDKYVCAVLCMSFDLIY